MADRSRGQTPAQDQAPERRPKPVLHARRDLGAGQEHASAEMGIDEALAEVIPAIADQEPATKNTERSDTDSARPAGKPLESTGEFSGEELYPKLDESDREEGKADGAADHAFLERRQRLRKELLQTCARVQMLDFQTLAMPGWPENFTLIQARRARDRRVFVMALLAVLFLGGVVGLLPAWLSGPAFGALVLVGALAVPGIRQWFTKRPTYPQLRSERQRLLRLARRHIEYLEGNAGLAWQCQPLAEYSQALRQSRFRSLYRLSHTGNLARYIRSRAHVRLYLMFLLEAEKAYETMEAAFVEGQQALREQAPVMSEQEGEGAGAEPGSP